ncbi:DEKNAAC101396 [Brettanomyces naardenensis]|uniref:DEKNAAC101396 n=1 Tax=Brettanomyces naardenensis TaxID=13370 RepID=A0A448YI43_BRENA|nr:DEKNAAC101396 [Brettanomyces naardenensis]
MEYKYRHVIGFRRRADSRISIIKQILPLEYQMSDFVLFNCIYFGSDNMLRTRYRDEYDRGVSIQQEKVVILGERLLGQGISRYVFESIKNEGEDILDLLGQVRETSRKMNAFGTRSHFIRQFVNKLESKDQLDVGLRFNSQVPIKIESSVRHKVVPALVGFVRLEQGPEKCDEFIQEFVIQGRQSRKKEYEHKGFSELYKEKLAMVYS